MHVTRLANSMSAIHALCFDSGIPVEVIKDNGVCSDKIDAQTTRARTKDKRRDTRVAVKALCQSLALLDLGGTVQSQISVAMIVEELFQDI